MSRVTIKRTSHKRTTKGSGLIGTVINKAIDALPIELHLPAGLRKSYRYCGPGTKLQERLARGDPGINELDESCKVHDIAYSLHKDNYHRNLADQRLADSAWQRVKSSDASLGEKTAAWLVTTAMKAKSKMGSGTKKGKGLAGKKKQKRQGKGLYLRPYTKRGGMLPLVPIFAGLSALGSLVGGVSTAIKAASGKGLKKKMLRKKKTCPKKKSEKKNVNSIKTVNQL